MQTVCTNCDSCCLFVYGIIFFFSKLIIFIAYSFKDSQDFHAIFNSGYIISSFYTIKCTYRRNWISVGQMFTYFSCGSFFQIIFTPIYFLKKDLRSAINIIRFSYWWNSNIITSSESITRPQKPLFYNAFFVEFIFVFSSEIMNGFVKNGFDVFLWIIEIILFTARYFTNI